MLLASPVPLGDLGAFVFRDHALKLHQELILRGGSGRALIELGVRSRLASNTAGSGLGPWYLEKAKALSVGLSNAYFKSLGLPSLFEDC